MNSLIDIHRTHFYHSYIHKKIALCERALIAIW